MTLFLIIFLIFLSVQYCKHLDKKADANKYWKLNKSNAPRQYDTACNILRQMGEIYRDYVSNMSLKDFMGDEYGHKFNYYKPGFIINNPTPHIYQTSFERMWVIITANACNLKINDNCLKVLYGQGVWESIPSEFTKEFMQEWKIKYSTQLTDKELEKHLRSSIWLKNNILYNIDNNSYIPYNNIKAIDYVAQKFDLPTHEEMKVLNYKGYKSLFDVCMEYTFRQSRKEGYLHIPLKMICINPTEEQKQIQYSKLSRAEAMSKSIRSEAEILKKYNM